MPLVFSNTTNNTQTSTPMISKALQSKIKPDPLPFKVGVPTPAPKFSLKSSTGTTGSWDTSTPQVNKTTTTTNTQTPNVTSQPNPQPNPVVPAPKPQTSLYSSVIGGLANSSNSESNNRATTASTQLQDIAGGKSNPMITAQSGLQDIATNGSENVNKANANLLKFQQQNPYMLAAQSNPNVASDVASGRTGLLGQIFGREEQALATAQQNALAQQGQQITAGTNAGNLAGTQQGQQITAGNEAGQLALTQQAQNQSALGTAGQLVKPEAGASYFGSPESGGIVGQGQGGTGNSLIDNSLSNAIDIVRRGGSTTDAMNSLVGGDVAKTAFINAMRGFDPNWNPTSSNAIATQNMTQGQTYQEQATNLDTGIKQLDIITPTAIDFINRSGLNSQDNPFYNKSIKEYAGQLNNPADVKTLNALMGDIKKYTAQILGATGEINPTRIGEINDTFDPSQLNASQLTTFLGDLKKLGVNQLSVLQGQSQNSYGGNTGYHGNQATVNTNLETATPNAKSPLNTNNPVIQGLLGGAMSTIGTVENAIKGFASSILK